MLEIKNVSKSFPGVKALDNVSIVFHDGEIHALLGENGAGKSTLMKIICGIYTCDHGEVLIDGEKTNFTHFSDAIKSGFGVVNQEIQVIPEATIAENIMLEKLAEYKKLGLIQWNKVEQDAEKYLRLVGLKLSPRTQIGGLSAAQKQLVQIAKALALDAKILMLDEPTASITKTETDLLFRILRKLKEEGVTIIFVSHKLEEVLELCDKLSVLRDGKYIGTKNCADMTKQDIIKMMIGRETKDVYRGSLDIDYASPVLELKNVSQEHRFRDVNLKLYQGEILGFYGLVGSGRTELAKLIIGDEHKSAGEILVNGAPAVINSVADCLESYKIGYVSENRKEEGLILQTSIKNNLGITIWQTLRSKRIKLISLKKETEKTTAMFQSLDIKANSVQQVVNNLSGGNQQKVSIGKWLIADCDILIIDEPTVGVDVGAKEHIYDIIWNLAKEQGKSIILISSDMPEIIHLARRILVFKDFEIVGEISNLNEKEQSPAEITKQIGTYLA